MVKPVTSTLFRGWRGNLAARFTLFAGLALTIISGASAYVGMRSERGALLDEMVKQSERLADLLATNSANALFTFNHPALEGLVEGFRKSPAIRFLQIKD